jgi:hypothetical protein
VRDFKECLEDLEQQVSDFTEEIEQLVTCTSDTTSLEVRGVGLHSRDMHLQQRATALTVGL